MSIMMRGTDACVHYFPEEEHPGFISVGRAAADGIITFFAQSPSTPEEVVSRYVVEVEKARAAAEQFLETRRRPEVLEWEEL